MIARHRRAVALGLALLVPNAALADGGPTLVASFQGDDPAVAKKLTAVMSEAAKGGGGAVSESSLDDVLALAGCASPPEQSCLAAAPAMLEVDRLVVGRVETRGDETIVHLTLVGGDGTTQEREVALRGDGDAQAEAFERHAAAFLAGEPPPADEVAAPPVVPPPAEVVAEAPADEAPAVGFSFDRVEPWTWGVVGGGAGLMLIGALLLNSASGVQDEVDAAPTDTAADLDRLADLEDEGRSKTRWGNLTLLVGTAAVATGAYFVVRQGRAGERPVRVVPTAVEGGAGVSLVIGGLP